MSFGRTVLCGSAPNFHREGFLTMKRIFRLAAILALLMIFAACNTGPGGSEASIGDSSDDTYNAANTTVKVQFGRESENSSSLLYENVSDDRPAEPVVASGGNFGLNISVNALEGSSKAGKIILSSLEGKVIIDGKTVPLSHFEQTPGGWDSYLPLGNDYTSYEIQILSGIQTEYGYESQNEIFFTLETIPQQQVKIELLFSDGWRHPEMYVGWNSQMLDTTDKVFRFTFTDAVDKESLHKAIMEYEPLDAGDPLGDAPSWDIQKNYRLEWQDDRTVLLYVTNLEAGQSYPMSMRGTKCVGGYIFASEGWIFEATTRQEVYCLNSSGKAELVYTPEHWQISPILGQNTDLGFIFATKQHYSFFSTKSNSTAALPKIDIPGYTGYSNNIFATYLDNKTILARENGTKTLNLITGEITPFLDNDLFSADISQCIPSPDGKRFAVVTSGPGIPIVLHIVDSSGNILHEVQDAAGIDTAMYYSILELAWLDNQHLLYSKNVDGAAGTTYNTMPCVILDTTTWQETPFPYRINQATVYHDSDTVIAGSEMLAESCVYFYVIGDHRVDFYTDPFPKNELYTHRSIMFAGPETIVLSSANEMLVFDLAKGTHTKYNGCAFGTDSAGHIWYVADLE